MGSIGFKEWAIVCEALGAGAQSIILRKGGIAERRDGFSFEHREFFLFPTQYHEQFEKVRPIDSLRVIPPKPGNIDILYFAAIDFAAVLRDWPPIEALQPFHIWTDEVVRERFQYDTANTLHVAFLRIFRLSERWRFPNEKRFGGCRTWVNLPAAPPDQRMTPVLSDDAHKALRAKIVDVIGAAAISAPLADHLN